MSTVEPKQLTEYWAPYEGQVDLFGYAISKTERMRNRKAYAKIQGTMTFANGEYVAFDSGKMKIRAQDFETFTDLVLQQRLSANYFWTKIGAEEVIDKSH